MKLAVLADLHANSPALNAVLDDLPTSVDTVVSLGIRIGAHRDESHRRASRVDHRASRAC